MSTAEAAASSHHNATSAYYMAIHERQRVTRYWNH